MIKNGLAVCLATLISAEAIAGTPKYDQMRDKDSGHPITYSLSNGEIVYDEVCQDKYKGTVAYRNCRREAQKLFRDLCKEERDKSKSPYCKASNRYYP